MTGTGARFFLTDEDLAEIGRVAVEAASLEELLEKAVWVVLGVSPEAGRILTRRRTAKDQITWLRKLLRAADGDACAEQINALCTAATQALNKRNTFIHGVLVTRKERPAFDDGTDFTDGTGFADDYVLHVRNRNNEENQSIPISEAANVADGLVNARVQFSEYLAGRQQPTSAPC